MGRRRENIKKTSALLSVRLSEEHYKKIQELMHDTQKTLNADYTGPTGEVAHVPKGDIFGRALVIGLKQILAKGSLR